MSRPGERSYRFGAASHWRAGAIAGFHPKDGGLELVAPSMALRIAGTEAGAVAAAGPCGRFVWLRRRTGEIVVLHEFGAEVQGRIGVHCPCEIHPGPCILWVRDSDSVHRFAFRSLQELGRYRFPGLVDSASDGCDGLWLLVCDEDGASIRHVDGQGRPACAPIALPEARFPAAIAADPARHRLAVLDSPAERSGDETEWRLHIVDLDRCAVREPMRFALAPGEAPPRRLAVDDEGSFRLASATLPVLLLNVAEDGVETGRQSLPASFRSPVVALIWRDGLILDCADGLYRLVAAGEESDDAPPARAAFITPILKSPPGTPGGWNRAEIPVTLPKGARLRATVYASDSPALAREVEAASAATATRPAQRLAAVEALIRGSEIRAQSYAGDGEAGQILHLLLDRIALPYLWLKLELECPAGAGAASLASLRVRYPDRSWLDALPAIYRDEPGPATQLRHFLAPFETLYDGLDETIDALPARIDPETAQDDWLPWLLGWLGLPPTAGLPVAVQRELLRRAGGLLAGRGTLGALNDMLDIVTQGRASVDDSGSAAFWVVSGRPGRHAALLGRDTRILGQLPIGFRPGTGMRLGEEPLPPFCADIGRVLGAKCALITIRIALDPAERAVVMPIIESLLAIFVPAHCRIALIEEPAGRTRPAGRLNRGWRLADNDDGAPLADPGTIELGRETQAGAWQLPVPAARAFTIDGKTTLDGVRRLA